MSSDGRYGDVVARLDEIVSTVKSKDASIERSLDLLDEALRLSMEAVEQVDIAEPSTEEVSAPDRASAGRKGNPWHLSSTAFRHPKT